MTSQFCCHNTEGKYVIFNGLRYATTSRGVVRDDFDGLATLLPHASAGYFEPCVFASPFCFHSVDHITRVAYRCSGSGDYFSCRWLNGDYRNGTTGQLNVARTVHALLKMINASKTQPDKGVTFKAGPGPCVGYVAGYIGCTWPFLNKSTAPASNQMNGTPLSDGARREAAAKLITFPLATFLCAAGPLWHLDYTWGYETEYFVPGVGETHALAGQPRLISDVPDGWYPALLEAPGTPLGECTYDAATSTFAREWSGVSVSLNVQAETATLVWK
jgi:hypothetical protein